MPNDDGSVLLLAGAWGTERELPARVGTEPGWHQPPHVRNPREARQLLVEQVIAGADAIVAPTYRTSRQALARFGEARRAREWTGVAVRLAREAVEEAQDRRPSAPLGAVRPDVLVCGSINPLAADDAGAHAEIMAEAGVDVLLVELMTSVAASRAATRAAASTGLPVWSGVSLSADGTRLESGESLESWVEALEPAHPARLLVYCAGPAAALTASGELTRLSGHPLGACLERPITADQASEILNAGFTLVGLSSGATTETLHPLRAALDGRLAEQAEAEATARRALQAQLDQAAAWAPGGPALWFGEPPEVDLPAGFDWTVAPVAEFALLPSDHFRLVVIDPVGDKDAIPPRAWTVVERGGIVLAAGDGWAARDELRLIDAGERCNLAILLRE